MAVFSLGVIANFEGGADSAPSFPSEASLSGPFGLAGSVFFEDVLLLQNERSSPLENSQRREQNLSGQARLKINSYDDSKREFQMVKKTRTNLNQEDSVKSIFSLSKILTGQPQNIARKEKDKNLNLRLSSLRFTNTHSGTQIYSILLVWIVIEISLFKL